MQIKLHKAYRVALDGRNDQHTFMPGIYSVPDEMAEKWAKGALSRGPRIAEEVKVAPAVETKEDPKPKAKRTYKRKPKASKLETKG